MFAPGEQLKKYRILEHVGESSLVSTFLAESSRAEKVVIRVFKGEQFTRDESFRLLKKPREASREGRILNKAYLSFCQTVALEEISPGRRYAYVIRKYEEGTNLGEWLASGRHWDEIKSVLKRICSGLGHLHRGELIHGGLSLQNVIVGGDALKLTDFGLSVNYLGPMLKLDVRADSDRLPFLPPWLNDPIRLQSPATDIFALGVLLYLSRKGGFPQGIPADSPLPVQKALGREYESVDEFWADVEELPDEEERTEEGPAGGEERGSSVPENDGNGHWRGEERTAGGRAPEAAPDVDISGEGVEGEPSGLVFRLKRIVCGSGAGSFVLRNLQKDGQSLRIRVTIVSGSEWLEVTPQEATLGPGEQRFDLVFTQGGKLGIRSGKVVLDISFSDSDASTSRDILIAADFTSETPFLPSRRKALSLWRWVAGVACTLAVLACILHFTGVPGSFLVGGSRSVTTSETSAPAGPPLKPSAPDTAPLSATFPATPAKSGEGAATIPLHTATPPPNAVREPSVLPSQPIESDTTPVRSQISQINSALLATGDFRVAYGQLENLLQLYPDNAEIKTLVMQMDEKLTIDVDLILPPGQGKRRQDGLIAIASDFGFRLKFTPGDTCYLYIYQVDSHNNVAQLFPNSAASRESNPVHGTREYYLPASTSSGQDYFVLDRNTGVETIYFVASRWQGMDLERLYADYQNASNKEERTARLQELIGRIKLRGVAAEVGIAGCFIKDYSFWHGEG